jgi:hypothetical protein
MKNIPKTEVAMTVATSKTFAAFLDTDVSRENLDPKLRTRLVGVGNTITTLNDLVRWARERYPDHYGPDSRKSTGLPYSREVMQRLWAKYLNWSEED